jgi:glycosyltransferase involved in cell wall biosynthesis
MDVPLQKGRDLDGVAVWYFPVGWPRRLYRSPTMKRNLLATIHNYDILHLHSVFLWPTWVAASIARKENVPYIVSPRGMLVPDLIRAKSTAKKILSIAMFDRRLLEAADAVHFTSELERQECESVNIKPARSIVIPNGVDPNEVKVETGKKKDKGSYVLYLGRINWKKGIDRLMRAVAQLPDTSLIIAGNDDGNYRSQLEVLAGQLGMNGRTNFPGAVRGREKWELLSGAAVLVLPSLSENFGNVVLESMLVKTPVIVTKGVGTAEIVNRVGAGFVTGSEPEKIARGIRKILESADLSRQCGEAGYKAVMRDYSWNSIGRTMTEAYREILARRNVRLVAHEAQ